LLSTHGILLLGFFGSRRRRVFATQAHRSIVLHNDLGTHGKFVAYIVLLRTRLTTRDVAGDVGHGYFRWQLVDPARLLRKSFWKGSWGDLA